MSWLPVLTSWLTLVGADAWGRSLKRNKVPAKYLGSLKGKEREARRREISRRAKEARRTSRKSKYRPFKTGKRQKTRPSSYTKKFHDRFGGGASGPTEAARMSYSELKPKVSRQKWSTIIKKVYDRGMAAWATGHRPGATQKQWAMARVYSFIVGGKTRRTADADLAREAGIR